LGAGPAYAKAIWKKCGGKKLGAPAGRAWEKNAFVDSTEATTYLAPMRLLDQRRKERGKKGEEALKRAEVVKVENRVERYKAEPKGREKEVCTEGKGEQERERHGE